MTENHEPETEYDYNLGQGRSKEHTERNETAGAVIVALIIASGIAYIFYELFKL